MALRQCPAAAIPGRCRQQISVGGLPLQQRTEKAGLVSPLFLFMVVPFFIGLRWSPGRSGLGQMPAPVLAFALHHKL